MNAPLPIAAHALLGPSSSKIWLTCTPAARASEGIADKRSVFADEGTFAHAVAEQCLTTGCNAADLCGVPRWEQSEFFTQDLREHVQGYVDYVRSVVAETRATCPDANVSYEVRLDLRDYIPEAFGTADVLIVADDLCITIDLKYGKGLRIPAQDNSQLRIYMLGALSLYDALYDIKRVRGTIYQPRLDHVDSEELTAAELLAWGEQIKPRAKLAWEGKGEFVPGAHCQFCRAKAVCRARAEANLELAKHDFAPGHLLSVDEIAEILPKLDDLKRWAVDLQEYSLEQALTHGVTFPGWKLVAGRSVRKYGDADAVAQRLLQNDFDESQIYERDLLGVTAMEKLLGKKKFSELLDDLVVKSEPKPTLVPQSDKRSEFNPKATAVADFS